MPSWILSAFTASVLYRNKRETNAKAVYQAFDRSVADLLRAGKAENLTAQQSLERVQALLLYQTMRIFDGEISEHAKAENDMKVLEDWNDCLCRVRDDANDVVEQHGRKFTFKQPVSWEVSS
jgi:hypothetical protein